MLIFKVAVSVVIHMAILGGLLFLPAGTLDCWRAWLLIGVIFSGSLLSAAGLFPGRKDLLKERLKSPIQKGQPLADRIVLMFFLMSFYGLIVFLEEQFLKRQLEGYEAYMKRVRYRLIPFLW